MSESVEELKIDIAQLLIQKSRLVQEKTSLTMELGEINAKCATTLPRDVYARLQRERAEKVRMIYERDKELSEIKVLIHAQNTAIDVEKRKTLSPNDLKQLRLVRDEWQAFSMDSKNRQPERRLAWKFMEQINAIIKPHFSD